MTMVRSASIHDGSDRLQGAVLTIVSQTAKGLWKKVLWLMPSERTETLTLERKVWKKTACYLLCVYLCTVCP